MSDLTFKECLMECAGNIKLVKEFDRLNNTNLSLKGSPLCIEIERVSGKQKDDMIKFIAFCWEYIWLPVSGGIVYV